MATLPEALGLLEFSSIGRGARVLDDVVKKAPVEIHTATTVSNGKYLLIFVGDVGPVEESFREGDRAGGGTVTAKLFLPQVHGDVVRAMEQRLEIADVDALAIVETQTMACTIAAADAAAKCTAVKLIEIRLGAGIGGKGFFTFTGTQSDVEASLAAAREVGERETALISAEIVNRPSAELIANWTGGAWREQSLPRARKS